MMTRMTRMTRMRSCRRLCWSSYAVIDCGHSSVFSINLWISEFGPCILLVSSSHMRHRIEDRYFLVDSKVGHPREPAIDLDCFAQWAINLRS